MIDFVVLTATLNKVIRPAVVRQMYERAPAWQLFGGWSAEESVAKRANVGVSRFENNKMYMPIRSSYHSGIVSIQPGEKYQYGSPTLNETYNQISTLVGSFQIQKAVLNTTNKGAIVKPLLFASETLANDLAMDANRQVYGGLGAVGVIATTASAGSSTTTVALTPSLNGDIDYSRYLPPGTNISIAGATGGTPTATQAQVVAQTGANTVTITPALTFSAGANIVKETGSNTASSEMAGLLGMVNTGSYQNLDSATVYSWSSSLNTTAETLQSTTIQAEMHKQYFAANKIGKVDWIIMNASLFQVYGRGLTPLVRFGQKEVLAGGWVGLDYMGGMAQVLLDYDDPDDTVYFLSTQDLVFGEYQPLEWEQGTEGVLFKIVQQLDYEVTASWMGQIGTLARGAQAAMRNKTAGTS